MFFTRGRRSVAQKQQQTQAQTTRKAATRQYFDFLDVLWGGQIAVVSHDSPRAQTCTSDGPGLQEHHETTPREEERMKRVGEKANLVDPAVRGPAEGWWSWERGLGGTPKFWTHPENFEHTPHRHTTPHNGGSLTGWSWARVPCTEGPWPRKQDLSNKLSRRAAPLAKVSWGQGWFAKVWEN